MVRVLACQGVRKGVVIHTYATCVGVRWHSAECLEACRRSAMLRKRFGVGAGCSGTVPNANVFENACHDTTPINMVRGCRDDVVLHARNCF